MERKPGVSELAAKRLERDVLGPHKAKWEQHEAALRVLDDLDDQLDDLLGRVEEIRRKREAQKALVEETKSDAATYETLMRILGEPLPEKKG
jgi:hypothetical protein